MRIAYIPSENVLPRTRVLSPYEARLFPRFPNRSTTFQPDIYYIARRAGCPNIAKKQKKEAKKKKKIRSRETICIVYTPSVVSPEDVTLLLFLKIKFMEALDDILKKRRSWAVMLDLLKPYIAPQNERMIRPAEEQWNSIPLQRQRQIWVTLWEQKLRGVAIKDHPYYAIKDCVPMPFNWNGTEHIKSMMANFKMVSAKYYNRYGIYTIQAAEAFQLTDIKPLNFKKDDNTN